MNSALLAFIGITLFALAYRLYGRFISRRVLSLNQANPTPSHTMHDGIDYVPTRPVILFGHHFASIAGLGPILGPAIGVMWGWAPVALWIILGTIFIGGIHDMGTLVVSIRNRGRSIGDITKDLIGPRARILFLLITFFLLSLAMGVFATLIAKLFSADFYPGAVLPVFGLILIAIIIGSLVYKTHFPLSIATLIGFGLTLLLVWLGAKYPVVGIGHNMWIYILLVYAFFASVLPVWLLLQPRDYVNSYLLYAGLALLYMGIAVAHPQIAAPAVHTAATKAVPIVPLLFITVACGAISGFHSLVSSGTTSKQLNRENESLPIAYGGMIAEGLLALAILLAVTAGLGTREAWFARYSSWSSIKDLSNQLSAIVDGSANLLSSLGIGRGIAEVFITVVAVSFAMTTLDTGTRLQRDWSYGNSLAQPTSF